MCSIKGSITTLITNSLNKAITDSFITNPFLSDTKIGSLQNNAHDTNTSYTDTSVNKSDTSSTVYIKYLPKNTLLYTLWEYAKPSQYLYYCMSNLPVLTAELSTRDINYMIANDRRIELTTYYGRLLFIDITDDYMDTLTYNLYNGLGTAEKVISLLKKKELEKSVLRYYVCT